MKFKQTFFLYNYCYMKFKKRKYINLENYNWFYDKKIHGTMLIFVSILFLIFHFLKVKFLSSIDGYTIGMLIGFYSPFFYFYFLYIGFEILLEDRIQKPSWIKFNKKTYWILVLIIIFLSTSMGFYQSKSGFIIIGLEPWKTFNTWFDTFTNKGIQNASAWFPGKTNGGLVGVFLFSLVASIFSGVGALVIGILLLTIFISIILTGTSLDFHKNILLKRNFKISSIFSRKKNKQKTKKIIQNEQKEYIIDEKRKNKILKKSNILSDENELNEKKLLKENPKNIKLKNDEEKKLENSKKEKENLPFDDPF
jgi:hypothetical protein